VRNGRKKQFIPYSSAKLQYRVRNSMPHHSEQGMSLDESGMSQF
jgi:hypothetical protein